MDPRSEYAASTTYISTCKADECDGRPAALARTARDLMLNTVIRAQTELGLKRVVRVYNMEVEGPTQI